jgi:hypothetical protein
MRPLIVAMLLAPAALPGVTHADLFGPRDLHPFDYRERNIALPP